MDNQVSPSYIATIDAHQHFWQYNPVRDSWIDNTMQVIQRDFFPADLKPELLAHQVTGTVVVQSDQSSEENVFQLNNAANNHFIKGVVGWVDLMAADVEEQLAMLRQHSKLKGFRHVLQGEAQRDLMLMPAFKNGISKLAGNNFTYDLLILPDQLPYALQLVQLFPNQLFVIDHLAKPPIKKGEIAEWKKAMLPFATCQNVYCKISGMVTEADWRGWHPSHCNPYMDVVMEIFGTGRVMYGSDWPVCLVAANYGQVINLVRHYFEPFSVAEKQQVFNLNAMRFYQLEQ